MIKFIKSLFVSKPEVKVDQAQVVSAESKLPPFPVEAPKPKDKPKAAAKKPAVAAKKTTKRKTSVKK